MTTTLTRAPVYLTGSINAATHAAAALQPRLGMLAQPGNASHLHGGRYEHWAIDNGAFGKASRGTPWTDDDTEDYLAYLARVVAEVDTGNVLFATAPDVLRFVGGKPLGDARATWERSRRIFPHIRTLGLPAALVAQDGITDCMRPEHWEEFDVLFLGGSDEFKLGWEAEEITRRARLVGKPVHMGRVNSLKRLRLAQQIGCDSADGTYIAYAPDVNLPKVLSWLASTEPRPVPAQREPWELELLEVAA